MTEWNVTFTNASPGPFVAAIWQELPDAGLTPVSWLQARVLPGEVAPFKWDDKYAVVLASYQDQPPSGIYTPDLPQSRAAKPGSTWDAITINHVDYLAEVDESGEGPIKTTNRSTGPVNSGLMQSGAAAAYAHDLPVDGVATFTLQPKFQFGLFADLQPGQVIERALVVVGPQPLTFPPGVDRLLVTAILQGQTIVLTVVPG